MNYDLREISIMRSLAIILIISCHLHFFINLGSFDSYFSAFSAYVSFIGLGMLFFISGFGLYYKYKDLKSLSGLITFYIKRAKRIFPLYWLSLLIIYIYNLRLGPFEPFTIPSLNHCSLYELLMIFLGFGPFLHTIFWFISVIIIYYLIYPILILPKNNFRFLLLCIIVFLMLLFLVRKFQFLDDNLWDYFFVFVSGIMMNKLPIGPNKAQKNLLFISLVGFLSASIVSFIIYFINKSYITLFIPLISISSSIAIYSIIHSFGIIFSNDIKYKLDNISFYSYSIYLFHGIIIGIFASILKHYAVTIHSSVSNILIVIFVPIVFLICYYIQLMEFKIISFLYPQDG